MSKEKFKNILISFMCDYDNNKWSNDDVYNKYSIVLSQMFNDLETKLAGLQQEKIEYTDTINFVETSEPDIVAKELDRLNQKLAESEKEYAELFSRNIELETLYSQKTALLNFYKDTDLVKENKELKQQLAEKEKEIKHLQKQHEIDSDVIELMKQNREKDKISFTLEQLEKIDKFTKSGYCFDLFDVRNEIDSQIKEIKGEK